MCSYFRELLGLKLYICGPHFKIYVLSINRWDWGRQCLFWSFYGICFDNKRNIELRFNNLN